MLKYQRKLHMIISAALTVVLFSISILYMPPTSSNAADSYSSLQQKLQQIQKQQKQINSELSGNKDKQGQVKKEIAGIDQSRSILQQQIQILNQQVGQCDNKIANTNKQIGQTQKNIDADTKLYSVRMVTLYEVGNVSYLQLLMSSKSITDFLTRYEIIKQIQQHDNDLIAKLKMDKSTIVDKQNDLKAQAKQLAASQAEYHGKQKQLNDESGQETTLLGTLKGQQSDYQKQNEAMSKTESALRNQMQAALEAAESGTYTGGSGVLSWPVRGPITCPFGMRTNPYTGAKNDFHDGIDIGAGMGTPIGAADAGTVKYNIPGISFSDMTAVYGYNYLFVIHPDGMITFYGHCSGRAVADGAHVSKGQTIAYVGSEGYSTGPHLHFGVYINGKAENPVKYLP